LAALLSGWRLQQQAWLTPCPRRPRSSHVPTRSCHLLPPSARLAWRLPPLTRCLVGPDTLLPAGGLAPCPSLGRRCSFRRVPPYPPPLSAATAP